LQNSPNSPGGTEKYHFMLFVSGMSVKSVNALENLRRICDKYLPGQFEIQIIDISKEKDQAVKYQIIAIPTLIKTAPNHPRTILGDLADTEKVLKILDINV